MKASGERRDIVLSVVNRVFHEFFDDSIPTVAGGITFFFLLAIFPAIACIVSLYGMIADRSMIAHDVALVSDFLPGGVVSIIDAELKRLISRKPQQLNLAFLGSLIVAVWSSSGGYSALVEGLNVAFETKETRSFFRLTFNALIFTVAAILFAIIALYISLRFPQIRAEDEQNSVTLSLLRWPVLFLLSVAGLQIVYHSGPNHKHSRWRWISSGSVIATILWLIGTRLFTWYVQHYGSYDRIYGDLGAAVGFLTWVWLSVTLLLLGAEINCELERR
jgi:membrane protein